MDAIRYVARWLLRFGVVWGVDAISLLAAATVVPGFSLEADTLQTLLVTAAAAAFTLGLVNLLVRPLILLLALPLGFFVTFAVGFLTNVITLFITAWLLPVFQVDGLVAACLGAIALAVVNTLITGMITVDDEDSFYDAAVEQLARRQAFRGAAEPGRGLVMIEIDGLSYWHIKYALDAGMLPTLQQMTREEDYVLSRVECGLPSQTSACQAGIMFGDNYDIPAFRWYDKERRKLFVSGADAAEINARFARGNGLLRGGSSINNMLNGDAEKSILTLADLRGGSDEERERRASDMYLMTANPYFFMRTVVLMAGDALLEIFQYLRACARDVQPRLDRLRHLYPLTRAVTTVFMRDVGAYLTALDILRGSPSIYVTLPGYDEVAHHSGPWSSDAFGVLRRHDHVIRRIRHYIETKAPRPYDLILLSDHGQSFGPTFKQRYGFTLKEFIQQHLPTDVRVHQRMGGDTGAISLAAVSGELDNIRQQGVSGRVGGAMVKQGQRAAQRAVERTEGSDEAAREAHIVAYGSGNLAQVYFDLYPRRITLDELNATYPGMVASLVQHEGIGIVAGYAKDGAPVVLSKSGMRNLRTGEGSGEDPLKPYGDAELRAWQVRRVMDYPHAGDLMVISTIYPDGRVAAFEELIGSHGGLGGEQTDAFLFHPSDMRVGETRNSTDVFRILNARRGLPVMERRAKHVLSVETVRAWAPGNLARGVFRQPSRWLGLALRSLVLDRSAYRAVAKDPTMTGPAVLISLMSLAVAVLLSPSGGSLAVYGERIVAALLGVLAIFGVAQVLGGKASYTATLRGVGFGSVFHLLNVPALYHPAAALARFLATVAIFLATWMAGAQAHDLRGWRTLVLPAAYIAVSLLSIYAIGVLLAGAQLSILSLAHELGLIP